jgi:hypothetical protein
MRILRVLKGIAKTAIVWAIAWVPLSFGLGLVSALFGAASPPREIWMWLVYRQAVVGAITGAAFAIALVALGRTRTLATLTYSRMAIAGALGGVIFPLITIAVFARMDSQLPVVPLIMGVVINGAVGAVCAAGSLRLARGAPELPPREPLRELDPDAA